jgi:DNA-binding MarR family transcriptional regulator
MLSDTERRILSRLSEFGEDIEGSWDVPRSLSLPGLADSLGLVRSSLHKPLAKLESDGYIFTRSAHVIGGGSRKRTVVHITLDGRQQINELSTEFDSAIGKKYGTIPNLTKLFGRDEDKAKLLELVNNGENIFLSGLPGIGKTSLARDIVTSVLNQGWTVRWATCYSNTDVSEISKQWNGGIAPRDSSALASYLGKNKNLLIIDEIQEIHPRHINKIRDLLENLKLTKASILVIVRSPNPFSLIENYSDFRLSGISTKDGRSLLPDELNDKKAIEIVRSLGGHPLALHLWSPESKLPEEVVAVQQFVESTIIEKLTKDGMSTLDELSLSPTPLEIDEIIESNGTIELDEFAILRWTNEKYEPHHLIRNVRRSLWSEHEVKKLHQIAAINWSERNGERALWLEAYHRIKSENFDKAWIIDKISSVSKNNTATAALLIEDALKINKNIDLQFKAVDLAFERAEYDVADNHLSQMPISPQKKLLTARLCRIRGDNKSAIDLEDHALLELLPSERVRFQVSMLVRKYDDRLPGKLSKLLANEILTSINDISFKNLSDRDRYTAELSLNLLKHAIALKINDLSIASQSRSELELILGDDEETLLLLDLRAKLAISNTPKLLDSSLQSIRSFIEGCSNPLKKIGMIHAALEVTRGDHPNWLEKSHEEFFNTPLRDDLAAYRRITAQCWYWRGVLNPNQKLSYWQEAIHRFRAAECIGAANELLEELTKSI